MNKQQLSRLEEIITELEAAIDRGEALTLQEQHAIDAHQQRLACLCSDEKQDVVSRGLAESLVPHAQGAGRIALTT